MPAVCLSVCLLATDVHENFTTNVPVDKEEKIKFGSHPRPDTGILCKILQTLQDGAFLQNLAHIIWTK